MLGNVVVSRQEARHAHSIFLTDTRWEWIRHRAAEGGRGVCASDVVEQALALLQKKNDEEEKLGD